MPEEHCDSQEYRGPPWAGRPFRDFLNYLANLDQVLWLSVAGISVLTGSSKTVKALEPFDEISESDIERARRVTELAQHEVQSGFPLLYAQALVSLWGGLESTVRFFVAAWLRNEPEAMRVDAVRKLRIRLGEYDELDEEERPYFILDLLENEIRSPLKHGVARFESLFAVFGLSGEVDDADAKNIYELSQLRNAIVHRRGIADSKLTTSCPWLGLSVGDAIRVDGETYRRHRLSVCNYVFELINRVRVHFGIPRHTDHSNQQTAEDSCCEETG